MRPASPAGSPLDDSASLGLSEHSAAAAAVIDQSETVPAGPAEAGPLDSPRRVASGPERPNRRWRPSRAALAVSLVVLLVVALVALATRREPREAVAQPSPRPSAPEPIPTSAPPPPPAAFSFEVVRVQTTSVDATRNPEAAEAAAENVATVLSQFYDQAFLEPEAWAGPPPGEIWNAFSPAVRKQAQSDARSFSLGSAGPEVETLDVAKARLVARVLLDGAGHPQAVLADVVFEANGDLAGAQGLELTNKATYLFRPSGGTWLIAGYPELETEVKTVPAPLASASPSAGPSGTPSP